MAILIRDRAVQKLLSYRLSDNLRTSLEIRIGTEIQKKDFPYISRIWDNGWSYMLQELSEDKINSRIKSGLPFAALYDTIEGKDVEHDSGIFSIEDLDGGKKPILYLQVAGLITEGNPLNIPEHYTFLEPHMVNFESAIDTIMLADITLFHGRRGSLGNHEAAIMMSLMKSYLQGEFSCDHHNAFEPQHIWTYSPHTKVAERVHKKNGGKRLDHFKEWVRFPLQYASITNDGVKPKDKLDLAKLGISSSGDLDRYHLAVFSYSH